MIFLPLGGMLYSESEFSSGENYESEFSGGEQSESERFGGEIAHAENACKKLNGLLMNGELVHVTQMRNPAPVMPQFLRKSDKNKSRRRRK